MLHHSLMLEQHDALLRSLVDSNNALLNQVSLLTVKINTLLRPTEPPSRPEPSPSLAGVIPAMLLPQPAREPYAPEHYAGDLGCCQAFLTQVSLVFGLQPASYSSDKAKIAYLISLLIGSARDWGTVVWECCPELCASYPLFVNEMKKVFDHPVRAREVSMLLSSLKQGSRSLAEFSVEFRTLAGESSWNDVAIQGAFYRGLFNSMKDELDTRYDPPPRPRLSRCPLHSTGQYVAG